MKENINHLLQLPEELLDLFWGKLKPTSVKKGDFFLKEGQYSRQIAIIQQGAFYAFYQKEDKEIIEDFCFEGCFIADYPSFIEGIPVKKNFKALKDSSLLVISKDDLEELYQLDWRFEKTGRLVAEYLFSNWEQKVSEVILLSPIERYRKIVNERKELLQRVPQYLIASYLNITPEYLSNIRKKILS